MLQIKMSPDLIGGHFNFMPVAFLLQKNNANNQPFVETGFWGFLN
jgi:hypothetical protein